MNIHTQTFAAESREIKPLAVVLVHGAGDHCGRYTNVIAKLTENGISVVTGDLPGHGLSDGLPGHVETFDDYLDAVEGWMRQAQELAGTNGRVVLVGHSMGGLIVVRYLQERGDRDPLLAGAVLSSPCLRLAMEVPGWKKGIANMLSTVAPKMRLDSGIDPAWVSRSQSVVDSYGKDPLCGGKVSARWYQELDLAMKEARSAVGAISVPVLLMQAGQDKLVAPEEAKRFYEQLPARAANRLVYYPEFYHELFNEPEQDMVFEEMLTWLQTVSS